jgi:hypothetical protein
MRGRRSRAADWDYERSNLILQLDYTPSRAARRLAQELLDGHPAQRGTLSQALVDCLAAELKVPPVQIRFRDEPQKHRRRGGRLTYKEYAHYDPGGSITIYNKTAVREKYLAPKAYLDTLVHEFLHHLDYELLKLQHTFHTKGFYSRLGDLLIKLQGRQAPQLELFSGA